MVPIFGAAYMVKFKDFSKPLSAFQILFKANLIFKDFTRQSCIFRYFKDCANPVTHFSNNFLVLSQEI